MVLRNHVVWLFPEARIQVDAMTVQAVASELAAAEPASVDPRRAEAALGLFGASPLPDDLYEPWAAQPGSGWRPSTASCCGGLGTGPSW